MYVTIDEFGRFDIHEGKHELSDLQEWVGGYVEHIDGPHGLDVWLNEEGKIKGLRRNPKVTEWLRPRYLMPDDYIAGKVVITGLNEKRLAQFREEFDDGITMVAL